MKKSNLLNILLMPLLIPVFSFAANENNISFQVPDDWRGDSSYFVSNSNKNAEDPSFAKGTDLILKSYLDALNNSKQPDVNSSWHLHSILFDLGISGSGKLGTLLLKGAPSVNVYWTKRQKKLQLRSADDESSDSKKMNITNADPLDAQIDSVVSSIYGTAYVRYSPTLKSDIKNAAQNFFAVMDAAELSTQKKWKVSRVRLDLNVGATGKVNFIQTVGGTVRVRLDWIPSQKHSYSFLSGNQSTVSGGMSDVLGGLMNELDLWSASNSPSGFHLSMLQVGLGMGANFQIGVVKSSASALVTAFFVPNPAAHFVSETDVNTPDNGIPFTITDNQSSWATALGVESAAPQNIVDIPFEPILVKRERIQNGLNRAMRIGDFFITRSTSVLSGSQWYVSRIKTALDLTLTGTLQVTSLSGMVSMAATFDNK
ncbi:MAG: hypothetical protein ACXVCY_03100 [Pseudobdellovibrionaceae bacterium]